MYWAKVKRPHYNRP